MIDVTAPLQQVEAVAFDEYWALQRSLKAAEGKVSGWRRGGGPDRGGAFSRAPDAGRWDPRPTGPRSCEPQVAYLSSECDGLQQLVADYEAQREVRAWRSGRGRGGLALGPGLVCAPRSDPRRNPPSRISPGVRQAGSGALAAQLRVTACGPPTAATRCARPPTPSPRPDPCHPRRRWTRCTSTMPAARQRRLRAARRSGCWRHARRRQKPGPQMATVPSERGRVHGPCRWCQRVWRAGLRA